MYDITYFGASLSMNMMFRPVSYGPCSRTGVMCVNDVLGRTSVTCVRSDFETSYSLTITLQSKLNHTYNKAFLEP